MFGTPRGSYAAGMERNASVTNRLIPERPFASRRSVAAACVNLTLRCLRAIGETYIQSSAYNPYWVGAFPIPKPHRSEARNG